MRLALIANQASGGRTDADRVAALLRAAGADLDLHPIPDVGQLDAAVDRVVVAGGDGSIGLAAQHAQRLGRPLAVVPTGTANDFARALDLPRDLEAACALAAGPDARTREVEVGSAAGRPFVNAASSGLSVLAARRAQGLKARLGPLAYAVGAIRAGAGAKPRHVVVVADGERWEGDAWQVIVACTGAFGGGAQLEVADPEDGRLDVALLEGGPRLALVRRAAGMRLGGLTDQPGVRSWRCRSVDVEGPPDWNVDGEACTVEPPRFTTAGRVAVVVGP